MVENYIKFDKENTCYKCPHCKNGNLYLSQDKLFEKQYETSIKKGTYKIDYRIYECEYEYEDRYYHGTISGQLKCNNIDCSEMTSFIGETKYYQNYHLDENSNDDVEVLEKGIYFKYFIPPIHIIEIRKEVNDELNKILLESFNLYFSSYYSCANSLRIFLEKFCELRGIRSEDEKGNFITLNQRLKKIDIDIDSDIKNLLIAIKWIGNEGSHSIDIVKKEDLDLTYKFVKKVLEYFYPIDNDSEVLQELANEVINEKGVLSKNKKHSFVD